MIHPGVQIDGRSDASNGPVITVLKLFWLRPYSAQLTAHAGFALGTGVVYVGSYMDQGER